MWVSMDVCWWVGMLVDMYVGRYVHNVRMYVGMKVGKVYRYVSI